MHGRRAAAVPLRFIALCRITCGGAAVFPPPGLTDAHTEPASVRFSLADGLCDADAFRVLSDHRRIIFAYTLHYILVRPFCKHLSFDFLPQGASFFLQNTAHGGKIVSGCFASRKRRSRRRGVCIRRTDEKKDIRVVVLVFMGRGHNRVPDNDIPCGAQVKK